MSYQVISKNLTKGDRSFKYRNDWSSFSQQVLKKHPHCCLNPLHDAEVVHHIKYRRGLPRRFFGMFLWHKPKASVSGREIIGYDVVPLCRKCHGAATRERGTVHHKDVWRQYEDPRKNHQVFWWALRLRIIFFIVRNFVSILLTISFGILLWHYVGLEGILDLLSLAQRAWESVQLVLRIIQFL